MKHLKHLKGENGFKLRGMKKRTHPLVPLRGHAQCQLQARAQNKITKQLLHLDSHVLEARAPDN